MTAWASSSSTSRSSSDAITGRSSWRMRFPPDTCRLWDKETHEKLDKDRFRRDLGNVEDAYQEVFRRLGIH